MAGTPDMSKKKLNIGMVGYGFMGRTHSNAFSQVGHFFDLPYQPVLKAICARDEGKVKAFAEQWGYESRETDWRKLVARPDIDVIDLDDPEFYDKKKKTTKFQMAKTQFEAFYEAVFDEKPSPAAP